MLRTTVSCWAERPWRDNVRLAAKTLARQLDVRVLWKTVSVEQKECDALQLFTQPATGADLPLSDGLAARLSGRPDERARLRERIGAPAPRLELAAADGGVSLLFEMDGVQLMTNLLLAGAAFIVTWALAAGSRAQRDLAEIV